MPFASDKLYKDYVRKNMARFATKVKVREILPHLSCLSQTDREEVEAKREMTGNYNAMQLLLDNLKRRENWPEEFIRALGECEHPALAQEMREAYEALKSTATTAEPDESAPVPSSPTKSSLPPSGTTEPSFPAKAAPETLVTPDTTSQPAPPPDVAPEAESPPPTPAATAHESTPPTGAEIPEVSRTEEAQAPDMSVPSEPDVPDGPTAEVSEPSSLALDPHPPTEETTAVSPELTKAPIQETSSPSSRVNFLQEPEETSDPTMHQISTEQRITALPEDEKVQPPPPEVEEVQPPPPEDEEVQPLPPEDEKVQPPPPEVKEVQPPPPEVKEVQPPLPEVEEVQASPPEDEEIKPPPPKDEEVQPPLPDMQNITPPAPAPVSSPVLAIVHHPPPSPVCSDVEEEDSLAKPEVLQGVTEGSSPSQEPFTGTQPPEPCSVTSGDLEISTPAGDLVSEANSEVSPRANTDECPEPVPEPETIPSLTEANHIQEQVTVKENCSPSHQLNGLLDDQAPSPHHAPTEVHSESLCSSSLSFQEQSTLVQSMVVHVAQDSSIQNQDGQEQSSMGDVVSSEDTAMVNHSDTQSEASLTEPTTNHNSLTPSTVGNEVHLNPVKEKALANEDKSCAKTEVILQAREREAQEEENKHQDNSTSNEEEPSQSPLAGLLPALHNAPLIPAAAAVGVCALVLAWKLRN